MRIKEKNRPTQKKWRVIGTVAIVGMLALLLTVTGLAIGEGVAPAPEMSIVATNLSFSDSVYIKYAVSFENVDSAEDIKLLVWKEAEDSYLLGT